METDGQFSRFHPKKGVSVAPKLLGIRCLSKLGYTKAVSPLKMTNFIWFFHEVFPHGLGTPSLWIMGPSPNPTEWAQDVLGYARFIPLHFFRFFGIFLTWPGLCFPPWWLNSSCPRPGYRFFLFGDTAPGQAGDCLWSHPIYSWVKTKDVEHWDMGFSSTLKPAPFPGFRTVEIRAKLFGFWIHLVHPAVISKCTIWIHLGFNINHTQLAQLGFMLV